MLKGRSLTIGIVIVLAGAGVVVLVNRDNTSPTGSAPSVSPAPNVAAQVTAPTSAPLVTVVGTINRILPNSDFVVNDGHQDYTIAMSSTAKIVNLKGGDVTRQFLTLGRTVQITGTLSDSTIRAQKVVIPTNTDQP
jgi:hypothetical protein